MTWGIAQPKDITVGTHVLPIDDLREHEVSRNCWCQPHLDDEAEGFVWIHDSMDGRELHEGAYGKPCH